MPPPYIQADPDAVPAADEHRLRRVSAVDRGVYRPRARPAVLPPTAIYYIFYTAETPNRDRLSRFTANASLTGTDRRQRGRPLPGPQDTTSASQSHHGGAIAFGNDGKIYFTTGDHFQGSPSQSLTSPRGKIHRINPDGTVPTDNPFYDGNGPNVDSIWALGLRNPVPRLLRRTDRQAVHRRRRRQRQLDLARGGRCRRPGRELRLARTSKGRSEQPGLHRIPSTRTRTTAAMRRSPVASSTTARSSRVATRAATSSPTTPRTGSSA